MRENKSNISRRSAIKKLGAAALSVSAVGTASAADYSPYIQPINHPSKLTYGQTGTFETNVYRQVSDLDKIWLYLSPTFATPNYTIEKVISNPDPASEHIAVSKTATPSQWNDIEQYGWGTYQVKVRVITVDNKDKEKTSTFDVVPGRPWDVDGDGKYEDIDGNGDVNKEDLKAFEERLPDLKTTDNPHYDHTFDGEVDVVDLGEFSSELTAGEYDGY